MVWKGRQKLMLTVLLIATCASVFVYMKYATVTPNKLCSGTDANCVLTFSVDNKDRNVTDTVKITSVEPLSRSSQTVQHTSSFQHKHTQKSNLNSADLGPGQTFVTYNDSVIVQCLKSSPYVVCPSYPQQAQQASSIRRLTPSRVSVGRKLVWALDCSFAQCRYNNCKVEENGPDSGADVVYFNGAELLDSFKPPHRPGNQTWIFMIWESPLNTRSTFLNDENSVWNKQFNMSISYRTDSDVFVPYGVLHFEPLPLERRPNYYEIAKAKSKNVIWFVSNCDTPSKRMQYVQELKKYIDVDIYGGCGIPCSSVTNNCGNELTMQYRFYLSFENSLCNDYITEKLFKLYRPDAYVIPVVRGGANYSNYIPENTFINTADFPSPRLLAEHLQSLSSDHKRYAQLLEHKDLYRSQEGLDTMWCHLCEYLNTKSLQSKTVNLKKWWSDGQCHQPEDFI